MALLHMADDSAPEGPALYASRHQAYAKWSGKRDSNPRPQAWKACALPTELFPRIIGGEGRIRTFEGIAGRFTVCSLWPLGNLSLFPFTPLKQLPFFRKCGTGCVDTPACLTGAGDR